MSEIKISQFEEVFEISDPTNVTIPILLNGQNEIVKANVLMGSKVDNIDGKGLSSNDYTDADKEKVNSIGIATSETAGTIKPGSEFDIAEDGTLSIYNEVAISSVSVTPSVAEKGSTVESVIVNWNVNKTPNTQSFNGESVATFLRSKTLSGLSLTSDTQYTVACADTRTSKTNSAWLRFYDAVYYGVGELFSDSAQITKTIRSDNITSFTANAGEGQYIWYAIPATYETPIFKVGGFDGGFSLTSTIDLTNQYGRTVSYKIFRSDNAGLGSTTIDLS